MEERRKNRRMELKSRIVVKRLDHENSQQEVAVEITDVSKNGVGFNCTEPLAIGAVYESFLTIWTKEVIHAFLEIVRIEKADDCFKYGAVFIGMPEIESSKIAVYDTVDRLTKE